MRHPRRAGRAGRRARTAWLAALVAAAASAGTNAASATAPQAGSPALLKVMALGDSLTAGAGSSHGGGYRLTFWTRLREEGLEVDMVGGKADGPETLDVRHQGYAPGTLHEISALAYDKLRDYEPDVVLVLAGTDEWRDDRFSPPSFAVNLGVLIDRILTARPAAQIFVGTIPPPKFGKHEAEKRQLNRLIRREVNERGERGQPVHLVDLFEVLDPVRDMLDANRPNDSGYEKIGEAFADAVLAVVGGGEPE
ncbi:MAG TPA: GDSL-type esterase/lipase family protein [Myxococcota bacterium]|jgi:lysophospholipase L1-like esterase|nr:GDSL-type esterase/lipase family protein [Myxococcota bacterium]